MNTSRKPVGIEDMAIYTSPYCVAIKDLAKQRGRESRLGVERFSVFYKTDVIKAGTAAVLELLEKNGLDLTHISRLIVATETSEDEAKPMGTNILGNLDKLGYVNEHVETCEAKFACVSGSYSLYDCCNYVTLYPDKKVVVVCVDEAKYDLGSPAEFTQGAGAIAMLVTTNPSLVELDFSTVGVLTIDGRGYYRPTGKKTPIVSRESIYEYLYCMRGAFDHYKTQTGRENVLEELRWLVFHNPYGLMVEDFVSYLLIHEHRDTEMWPEILEQIGMQEPVGSGVKAYLNKKDNEKHAKFRKKFRELDVFQDFFKEKVADSIIASRQTGNLYTGSLFLQLGSLCTYGNPQKGDRVGFWGFGSGAGSLFYTGALVNKLNFGLEEKLKNRKELSIQEYEAWRNAPIEN